MKKYKSIIVVSFILMVLLCLQSANAISFVNGQQLITPDVNDAPDAFAVSGNLAAWTDWRDDDPKVYATLLNDPAHTKYTIDADAWQAGWIAIDANAVIYTAMNSSTERVIICIANISDINNPVIEDINVIPNEYPDGFDVKDGIVVYTIDRYSRAGTKIYAIDLSDQYKTPHLIYTFDPENESLYTNISLDGRRISWCGKDDEGLYYLAVCDINDINNPQTTHTYLPQDTRFFDLDTSNDWLVMFGYYMDQRGIFALKNYSSSNDDDWVFVDIFATGELYSPSSVKIDEPFVVWTQYYTDGMQAAYSLMSALLLDNDSVAISSLKEITYPNIGLYWVEISGSEIVWTEQFYDQMTQEEYKNLYNAALQVDCGDYGFSLADLNHDSYVNLKDLAILAEQWLQSPGTPSADIAPCPNGDGIVNFLDFAEMVNQWLTEEAARPDITWVSINDSGADMKDEFGDPINHGGFSGEMSKYETTNAQYCQYLNSALASDQIIVHNTWVYATSDTSYAQPYFSTYDEFSWPSHSQIIYDNNVFSVRSRDGESMDNHPVVMVSWYGATAFCNYYGWRLPTEWQWQAVADYDGSYIYGYGENVDSSKANFFYYVYSNPLGLSEEPYTSPVDYYPDFGYGMCDMSGNAWEWTSTLSDDTCVLRGGSWYYSTNGCTVTDTDYSVPDMMANFLGFRVCRDTQAEGFVEGFDGLLSEK